MPPKECTLVLFTEEYFGQNVKNIDVSLGFACDLHDHILADLKMFGKEGLRFRFWQFVRSFNPRRVSAFYSSPTTVLAQWSMSVSSPLTPTWRLPSAIITLSMRRDLCQPYGLEGRL